MSIVNKDVSVDGAELKHAQSLPAHATKPSSQRTNKDGPVQNLRACSRQVAMWLMRLDRCALLLLSENMTTEANAVTET
jgi:hypothetical protein